MRCLPLALLFLGIASSAAVGQEQTVADAPGGPAASAAPADDDEGEIVVEGEVPKEKRRVCETRVATGSIRPKRVCRTVAQIEQEQHAAREAMESVNRDRETRDLTQAIREGVN